MIGDDIRSAYHGTKWALLLRGIYGLVLGLFILARPLASVAALALVIAFWALLDGITSIVRGFAVRNIAPHWWVMLITGLVSVAFGVAAFYYYPGLSLTFAVLWTSFWLFTAGVMAVFVAMQERRLGVSWVWTMTLGLLSIVGGILAYMYPAITLSWLLALIATYGIVSGIVLLIGAWKLQAIGRSVDQMAPHPARA
jgi:uncharacterized membrane protein HdeD (DUF308 family)